MTGPRKRTLLLAAGLVVGALAGGTATSSVAARTSDPGGRSARKNYSTSVKNTQNDTAVSLETIIERPHAGASRYHPLTPPASIDRSAPGSDVPFLLDEAGLPLNGTGALFVAAFQQSESGSASDSAGSSSSSEAAAISEALARRRAWAERGRRRIDPEALAEAQRQEVDNDDLVRAAMDLRGTRYRWGGASRGGFDCSGFVMYVYARERRVMLPHSSRAQVRCGVPVSRKDLQPGDLLFFGYSRRGINHVGIYIGDNKFVHAAGHTRNVRVDSLAGHYTRRLVAARRIPARRRHGQEARRQEPAQVSPEGEPPNGGAPPAGP